MTSPWLELSSSRWINGQKNDPYARFILEGIKLGASRSVLLALYPAVEVDEYGGISLNLSGAVMYLKFSNDELDTVIIRRY